jgi:hypothetical protein
MKTVSLLGRKREKDVCEKIGKMVKSLGQNLKKVKIYRKTACFET